MANTSLSKLELKEWDPESISPWKRGDDECMDGSKVLVCGRSGLGKCMAPDTLVKMCSGVLRRIDGVLVGDLLLGPDSRPRKVVETVHGMDQMYTVHQADSDPYVVTGDHKLVLYNAKEDSIVVRTAQSVFRSPRCTYLRVVRKPTVRIVGRRDPSTFEVLGTTFVQCRIDREARVVENIPACQVPLAQTIMRLDGYACQACPNGAIRYTHVPDSGIGGLVRVTKNPSATEPYFGVQVSKDGLYCLADDTVTHNSTIAKTLLYEKRGMFDSAVLFTGNKGSATNDWAPIIPELFHYVTEDVTADAIKNIVHYQEQYNTVKRATTTGGELHSKSNMALVMDDISGYRTQFNKLSAAFNNSRHYSIFMLVCAQQYTNVSPEVRKAMNVIITMGADSVGERDRLYDEFFSFLPSKAVFYEILDAVAQTPYMALVGDRDVHSGDWRDRLFYYRAKPHPPTFKLGTHSFWHTHYTKYDSTHDVHSLPSVATEMHNYGQNE